MSKYSKKNNPYYATKYNKKNINTNYVDNTGRDDDAMSENSVNSNKSDRQLLFQRSRISESRLSNRNMSESKFKYSINQSKVSLKSKRLQKQATKSDYDRKYESNFNRNSENSIHDSKNQLLAQIADKLKNRSRVVFDAQQSYRNSLSYADTQRHYQNRSLSLRKQEDKKYQFGKQRNSNQPTYQNNIQKKNIRTKLNKLENLLKDIKKSNREALQVAHKSQVKQDNLNNKPQLNVVTEIYNESNIESHEGKKSELEQLANQLKLVRQELKDVKMKNQEILSLSQSRSNFDAMSQSSKASTFHYQPQHIDQQQQQRPNLNNHPQNPYYKNPQIDNEAFTKKNKIQNKIIIQPSEYIQPCFACGCVCKARQTSFNRF